MLDNIGTIRLKPQNKLNLKQTKVGLILLTPVQADSTKHCLSV